MTTSQIKPIPDGMHSVTPYLTCAGAADAITFYIKAFGATELFRLPGPQGAVMHAQIKIGDSVVMLGEECAERGALGPKARKGTSVTIHLYVNDVNTAFAKAVAAGATVKMQLEDMFWGDRYGVLEDPFGHQWSLATHMRDVGPEEMQQAMQKMSQGQG
jgi:PhnB protein